MAIGKVVYKPDSQSTDVYMIVVDSTEYKKWKDGDTSIPLALVVDSFDIFHSGQGAQGQMGKVSKQMLDTVFGTTKEDDAVRMLLERGTFQDGGSFSKHSGDTNMARGSGNVTSKGSVGGGR